jgi:hypothetical protein
MTQLANSQIETNFMAKMLLIWVQWNMKTLMSVIKRVFKGLAVPIIPKLDNDESN